jgi:hypothetical protein
MGLNGLKISNGNGLIKMEKYMDLIHGFNKEI